jgi:caffeoyl-CoA O-methyltransferase
MRSLVPERPAEIRAMEAYGREQQFPIIGPVAGTFCYQIARLTGARRVFELGSGYGYSTAFFARAVRENGGGVVYHTVWDQDLSDKARAHLTALGYDDIVRYQVREALEALREADGPFDLIFNDIDKDAYPKSLETIEAKLRPGGVLITDNVLWSGRIFDDQDRSADTEGIREFNRMITTSRNWISSLIPIRDGLMLSVRTGQ